MNTTTVSTSRRSRTLVLSCVLLLGNGIAQSAETLSLNQALQQTLDKHPQLLAFPYELRQRDAEKSQAALRPNPRFNLDVANVLGSDQFEGTDAAELTLGLSQKLELGDKRKLRTTVAEGLKDQDEIKFSLTKLEVLGETKRRYYELQRLEALQTWLESRSEAQSKAVRVIRQRASAGAVGQADVSKMALQLADSKALLTQLSGDIEIAKQRLAAMWLSEAEFSNIEPIEADSGDLPNREQLLSSLDQSPQFQQTYVIEKLAKNRVALSQANGRSDMDIGIGVRRFESSNDQALVFNFSMPLALTNPNQGNIAKAESQHQQAVAQGKLKQQTLRLAALQIRQRLINLQQQSEALKTQLIPLAQTLLNDTKKGYRRGNYNVLQWADAQSERFRLDRELIETRHQYLNEVLELERLTGQDFASLTAGDQ